MVKINKKPFLTLLPSPKFIDQFIAVNGPIDRLNSSDYKILADLDRCIIKTFT